MTRKIRAAGPKLAVIRDTSAPLPRVTPGSVETALGAEASGRELEETLAPITLFAVRSELLGRLQSNEGPPALSGTSRRVEVPVADADWAGLEELAAAVSGPGFNPSAGQVASVLLNLSVRSVVSQLAQAPEPAASPLAREIAARAKAVREGSEAGRA